MEKDPLVNNDHILTFKEGTYLKPCLAFKQISLIGHIIFILVKDRIQKEFVAIRSSSIIGIAFKSLKMLDIQGGSQVPMGTVNTL